MGVSTGGNAFLHIGHSAIPQAIALLKHRSPSVRMAAAEGFFSLSRRTQAAAAAIPALTEALDDSLPQVRAYSLLALANMGSRASNAVPALARLALNRGAGVKTNDASWVQDTAVVALGKLGAAARDAIPALKSLLQAQNSGSKLRGKAALAIWRIDGDVDPALAVFLQEMPLTSDFEKNDWIRGLGEMGPRARAAIPQLQRELVQDRPTWSLESVTNALLKIDPDAAAKGGVFPAAAKNEPAKGFYSARILPSRVARSFNPSGVSPPPCSVMAQP